MNIHVPYKSWVATISKRAQLLVDYRLPPSNRGFPHTGNGCCQGLLSCRLDYGRLVRPNNCTALGAPPQDKRRYCMARSQHSLPYVLWNTKETNIGTLVFSNAQCPLQPTNTPHTIAPGPQHCHFHPNTTIGHPWPAPNVISAGGMFPYHGKMPHHMVMRGLSCVCCC